MHITVKKNGSALAAGLLVSAFVGSCAGKPTTSDTRLTGDWDYSVMLGAAPNGGFEARRRMGVAHVVARQRILHDGAHRSFVRLPLIGR